MGFAMSSCLRCLLFSVQGVLLLGKRGEAGLDASDGENEL